MKISKNTGIKNSQWYSVERSILSAVSRIPRTVISAAAKKLDIRYTMQKATQANVQKPSKMAAQSMFDIKDPRFIEDTTYSKKRMYRADIGITSLFGLSMQ